MSYIQMLVENFILKFRYICLLRPKQILLHLSLKLIVMWFICKLKQLHILTLKAVLGHWSDIFRFTLINKVQVVPGFPAIVSSTGQYRVQENGLKSFLKLLAKHPETYRCVYVEHMKNFIFCEYTDDFTI